jgi:hypothetical protein
VLRKPLNEVIHGMDFFGFAAEILLSPSRNLSCVIIT